MDGLLQDPVQHSRLETLVSEQRYEESVSLLNDVIERNPRDRDAYLFRLLVVRILVLRRQLDARQDSFATLTHRSFAHAKVRSRNLFHSARARASLGGGLNLVRAGSAAVAQFIRARSPRLSHLRHFVWRVPAVFVIAALSLISIIAVLCVFFLTGINARSRAIAPLPIGRKAGVTPADPAPVTAARSLGEHQQENGSAEAAERRTSVNDRIEPVYIRAGEERGLPAGPTAKLDLAMATPKSAKEQEEKQHQVARLESKKLEEAGARREKVRTPAGGEAAGPIAGAGNAVIAKAPERYYTALRPITLREAPRFGAATVLELEAGKSLRVLEVKDAWAKVLIDSERTGFVRVEFLTPAAVTQP